MISDYDYMDKISEEDRKFINEVIFTEDDIKDFDKEYDTGIHLSAELERKFAEQRKAKSKNNK